MMDVDKKSRISKGGEGTSVLLLIALYFFSLILLRLYFPTENDLFSIPFYYFSILIVLQLSFIIYYKYRLRSLAFVLLILMIVAWLFSGFLLYYVTGLAGAFKN